MVADKNHFDEKPTLRPHGLPSEALKILRGLKSVRGPPQTQAYSAEFGFLTNERQFLVNDIDPLLSIERTRSCRHKWVLGPAASCATKKA